jgi:hypothetical protein
VGIAPNDKDARSLRELEIIFCLGMVLPDFRQAKFAQARILL